jgi:hypothetical protein
MRIDPLVTVSINRLVGYALRKIALTALMVYFILVAIHYFGSAGIAALSTKYGIVNAQLIVAAIYIGLGIICLVVLWIMNTKTSTPNPLMPGHSSKALILMLVEAALLGYRLARKRDRGS